MRKQITRKTIPQYSLYADIPISLLKFITRPSKISAIILTENISKFVNIFNIYLIKIKELMKILIFDFHNLNLE